MQQRRALRRATLFAPAVALSWALVVGLPTAPQPGSPGRLEESTIRLTGPDAVAVAPATEDPAATTGPKDGKSRAEPGGTTRRTTGAAAQGWSAAVDLDDGTQMLGLTWDDSAAAAGATLEIRSRQDDQWSPWQHLDSEPDEGPDAGGNGRAGTDLVWLGHEGADQVEVRVDGGMLDDLSMERMHWIDPTPGSNGQAHAEPAGPGIRPRSDWAPGGWKSDNADCGKAPKVMKQMRFAVVHHTVNSNDYTASQVPGILAGIYRYHTGSKGWCDIAYNFVIDRFGTVWQGRSGDINTPVLGGHAKGFNTDSAGVALLGQYQAGAVPAAAKPSAAQVNSLESLLAWKLSIHGINPTATIPVVSQGSSSIAAGKTVSINTISGHKDTSSTSCPGGNVYSLLPAIRTDVAKIIADQRNRLGWSPFATPRTVAAQQYQDFLGRLATDTEKAGWASRMQRDKVVAPKLITDMLGSAEFADRRAPVVRLYLAYFGRIPDHSGLTYWWKQLADRSSKLDDMSSSFAGSSEFDRQYGSLTARAFVDRVYRNVLGRPPDANGLSYWTDQIASGARRRGAVMTGFSESSENRRITADKVNIITVYEAMLARPAAATSYIQWIAKLAGGASITELVDQAYNGGEYAARIRRLG